jgi:transglutaminase-like putative cysteine protease
MKVSVTHSTIYRYDFPVYLEPHIFRLRPRTNSAQSLLAFDLQIAPAPAGTTECLDQDGTLTLNAWFDSPTSELSVVSRFTVEMLREKGFDHDLASPVAGWYSGGSPSRMEARICLQVDHAS